MSQLVDHVFCAAGRTSRSAEYTYSGTVVTTTSGALGTGAANVDTPFFTLTKTAAKSGRYKVQLIDSQGRPCVAPKLVRWGFGLIGDTNAAVAVVGNGLIRNNLINTAGTFEIQFQTEASGADAEVADGSTIMLWFVIKKGSANP